MKNALGVDEKWSIKYDPNNNDKPAEWYRHEKFSAPFSHQNHILAMFYALLARNARIKELEKQIGRPPAPVERAANYKPRPPADCVKTYCGKVRWVRRAGGLFLQQEALDGWDKPFWEDVQIEEEKDNETR